jgi:hypothetical protein
MGKISLTGIITAVLVFSPWVSAQKEEPLKETVSVINVEVPVRVFSGDQAVPGLNKDDFQIFEDGKPQMINGFYVQHKKIGVSQADAASPGSPLAVSPGRYFVLIFRTYEFNDQLKTGISYLFQHIFLPDDQVLIMANNQTLFIHRIADDSQAQNKICEKVKTESWNANMQMLSRLQQIEQNLSLLKFQLGLREGYELGPEYIIRFLQSYQETWRDFKRSYLLPDISTYYYFAKHLERVKKEKWVLNFYQLEQFPQIANTSDIKRLIQGFIASITGIGGSRGAMAEIIKKLMQSIDMEMSVADDFPSAEVSKLFYKVNATFHSFFMRITKDTGSDELQFRNVATDIENSLRQITEKTGGSLLASNNLTQSLETVSEKEDVYYMLTYEPTNGKKVGKIKVLVKNKNYNAVYDNNMRADYINEYLQKREAENPSVRIRDLACKDKTLSFSVYDFSQTKIKNEITGMLQIRIRIKNSENQTLFDQKKALQAPKKTFSLSLNFNFLVAGKYDILVDVLDQVSGKSCTEIIQPLVE